MRNRNTIEFLGLWESLHNPSFNRVQFDTFRTEAGLNRLLFGHKFTKNPSAQRSCPRVTHIYSCRK